MAEQRTPVVILESTDLDVLRSTGPAS